MSKTKTVIQIFPLLQDINALERVLISLKNNSLHIDSSQHYIILD